MENYILNSGEQISNQINVSDNQIPQIIDRLGNEIRVISTKFCKASFFDTIDFADCLFDLIENSNGNYYNPVSFRYNLDPTFWKDIIESY